MPNQVLSFYACISSYLIVEISVRRGIFLEIRVFHVNRVLLVFRFVCVSLYVWFTSE